MSHNMRPTRVQKPIYIEGRIAILSNSPIFEKCLHL